ADVGTADGAALPGDRHVVAVLDQDGVAAGVGDVHPVDDRAAALGDAEHPASSASGDDGADPHVGRVGVADAPVAVGHAEGGVAGAGARALRVHGPHGGVERVVEQQAGLAGVAGGHGADGDALDAVGLHAVTAGAGDVDVGDVHVPGPHRAVVVVVDADAEPGGPHAQVQLSQGDVGAVADEHPEVRRAGHVQPGHLDVGHVPGPHDGVVGADRPGHVDRAAHLQDG